MTWFCSMKVNKQRCRIILRRIPSKERWISCLFECARHWLIGSWQISAVALRKQLGREWMCLLNVWRGTHLTLLLRFSSFLSVWIEFTVMQTNSMMLFVWICLDTRALNWQDQSIFLIWSCCMSEQEGFCCIWWGGPTKLIFTMLLCCNPKKKAHWKTMPFLKIYLQFTAVSSWNDN